MKNASTTSPSPLQAILDDKGRGRRKMKKCEITKHKLCMEDILLEIHTPKTSSRNHTISPSNQALRLVPRVALGTSAQPVFLSELLFI